MTGLRNPWRFSFDRATGDLWIGDVGQNQWEEIDLLPAPGLGRGANLGWALREGTNRFTGDVPADHVQPVHEYDHGDGCSVTGGYVYRGTDIPDLAGTYVFSDFCQSTLRVLRPGGWTPDVLDTDEPLQTVASFGEDADGELLILELGGAVKRLTPA